MTSDFFAQTGGRGIWYNGCIGRKVKRGRNTYGVPGLSGLSTELIRAVLDAVAESGLDLAACESETDVKELVLKELQ